MADKYIKDIVIEGNSTDIFHLKMNNKLSFSGAITGSYDGSSASNIEIPLANGSMAGLVQAGKGVTITNGTISAAQTWKEL